MDLDPDPDPAGEKSVLHIREKMESIDYSHGVQAAISASRAWDGGDGDMPTLQTVDYHHGQGAQQQAGDTGPGPGPAPGGAEYGGYGGFPAYQGYEGFTPDAGAAGGFFPSGVDPATLFAAYSEQAGESLLSVVCCMSVCLSAV